MYELSKKCVWIQKGALKQGSLYKNCIWNEMKV